MAKKTVMAKVVDAVDKMIHPDHVEQPVEASAAAKVKKPKFGNQSSPEKSDYANHPKFAKFKSTQGAE